MKEAIDKVYFIRHGMSVRNLQMDIISGRSNDSPLIPTGAQQAERAGKHLLLEDIQPGLVYASPAIRTRQTAQICLAAMGLPNRRPQLDDGLQELDQGQWVDRPRAVTYAAVQPDIDRQGKDFKAPGGESQNETGRRMWKFMEREIDGATDTDGPALIFGHRMAFLCMVSRFHPEWDQLETAQQELRNGSISQLTRAAGDWQLDYINLIPK